MTLSRGCREVGWCAFTELGPPRSGPIWKQLPQPPPGIVNDSFGFNRPPFREHRYPFTSVRHVRGPRNSARRGRTTVAQPLEWWGACRLRRLHRRWRLGRVCSATTSRTMQTERSSATARSLPIAGRRGTLPSSFERRRITSALRHSRMDYPIRCCWARNRRPSVASDTTPTTASSSTTTRFTTRTTCKRLAGLPARASDQHARPMSRLPETSAELMWACASLRIRRARAFAPSLLR